MEQRYRGDPINDDPYEFPIWGAEPRYTPEFDESEWMDLRPPEEEAAEQVFSMDATWSVLVDEEKTETEEDEDEAFTIKPFQITED